MSSHFGRDPLPGRPRILFVGWAHSTHTHAWIDLVREDFNVRLYAMPLGFPPDNWPVRTYVTQSSPRRFDPATRKKLYPLNRLDRDIRNRLTRLLLGKDTDAPRHGLAKAVRSWKPHVVHVLGLDPAGFFADQVRRRFSLEGRGAWVLQLRGGSDLALAHADPAQRERLARTIAAFDHVLADNHRNADLCAEFGVDASRFAPIVPVPGTGGVDVDGLRAMWTAPASKRRDILYPKAYECPWSKSLPVLEALRLCWDSLGNARVHMLAADQETRNWHRLLPAGIRERITLHERIPRPEALALMARCRVTLAPSLVDGVPNTLYEAMALGAVPIVSPLDTITPVVRQDENVLFAENLRPGQIAAALTRAAQDDALADRMAQANVLRVRELADRAVIGPKVRAWYGRLAEQKGEIQ